MHVASSPGHSNLFNATLKRWEWPGDEATGDARSIVQEEKGFAVVVFCSHCVYFIYCLFMTL